MKTSLASLSWSWTIGASSAQTGRTRSGRVHGDESVGLKRRRSRPGREKSSVRHSADGDMADEEENGDESDDFYKLPPVPLVGKMFSLTRKRKYQHDLPSSPARLSSPHKLPLSSPRRVPFLNPQALSPSYQNSVSPTCSLDMDMLLSPNSYLWCKVDL